MDSEQTAARVFAIPELLEQILLSFDDLLEPEPDITFTYSDHERALKALLVNQRVNKTFQATINHSPRIQQALFFRRPSGVPIDRLPAPLVVNFILSSRELYSIETRQKATIARDFFVKDGEFVGLFMEQSPKQKRANVATMHDEPRAESWRRMFITSSPIDVSVIEGDDEFDLGPDATLADMLEDYSTVPRSLYSRASRRSQREEMRESHEDVLDTQEEVQDQSLSRLFE